MRFKALIFTVLLLNAFGAFSQKSKWKKYRSLSGPEKCWVIFHPFVAKKALQVSEEVRKVTNEIKEANLLKGNGNGGQVDAFRHTFWMASLTLEIGSNKAKSLGDAHEKGNHKDYKKRKLEDGVVPDKVSSDMDYFNNDVGINIGELTTEFDLKEVVVEAVKEGRCKIIKMDDEGNFLDIEGNIIPMEKLKGTWENEKCLVNSNQ